MCLGVGINGVSVYHLGSALPGVRLLNTATVGFSQLPAMTPPVLWRWVIVTTPGNRR